MLPFSPTELALRVRLYNSRLLRLAWRVFKYLDHLVMGTSELYRVCARVARAAQQREMVEAYETLQRHPQPAAAAGSDIDADLTETSDAQSLVSASSSARWSTGSVSGASLASATIQSGRTVAGGLLGALRTFKSAHGENAAVFVPWTHLLAASAAPDASQWDPTALLPLFGDSGVRPRAGDAAAGGAATGEPMSAPAVILHQRTPTGTPLRAVARLASSPARVQAATARRPPASGPEDTDTEPKVAALSLQAPPGSDSSGTAVAPSPGPKAGAAAALEMLTRTANVVATVDLILFHSAVLAPERRILESPEGNVSRLPLVASRIVAAKGFGAPETAPTRVLGACLRIIADTNLLIHSLNARAATPFDPDNKSHQRRLVDLWTAVRPLEPYPGPVSPRWTLLGFQGHSPATDFRGMGLLGLDDLIYFARNYPDLVQQALDAELLETQLLPDGVASADPEPESPRLRRRSQRRPSQRGRTPRSATAPHSVQGLSFAITSINVTYFALTLARTRYLHHCFFKYGATRNVYHELQAFIFATLLDTWSSHSSPLSIMDYQRFFREFQSVIRRRLQMRQSVILDEDALVRRQLSSALGPLVLSSISDEDF